ncbi:hypothetical protein BGM25_08265 [Bacillus sp. FJAT-29953]|nr:hypothetical protein [Bacillus sp. FJAT-29953]
MGTEFPEELSKYVDIVFDKITMLIKQRVWGNVSLDRFKRWTSQFKTIEDKYNAAYLAYNLIFYNKKDFTSLITWSIGEAIKKITLLKNGTITYKTDTEWKGLLTNSIQKTLICPLITDSAAASGFMVTRLLRDQGIIPEVNTCVSKEEVFEKLIRAEYEAVIFVDDMIGSGDQAITSLHEKQNIGGMRTSVIEKLHELRPDINILIAVAVSPLRSIEKIESTTGVTVIAAEILTERNELLNGSFWSQNEFGFQQGIDFLKKIKKESNIPYKGYNDSSWVLTFEHGAPDITSPFYFKEYKEWTSLVRYRGEDN